MALFIGLIGLPNVGKSTLFNALTRGHAEASNYAFCTVEPNVGMVEVEDVRLRQLRQVLQPPTCIGASIRFVDIAGLVRGASRGEGLGNQFLAHVRAADALVQVVRCFEDGEIAHVDGPVDPVRDVETLETELLLADLEKLEKTCPHLEKVVRSEPRSGKEGELAALQKALEGVGAGRPIRALDLEPDERAALAPYQLLTAKPMIYAANIGEGDDEADHPWIGPLGARVGAGNIVALSARLEAELAELTADEQREFLADMGVEERGAERLVRASYGLLDLLTFYTLAHGKLQAWPLERGTRAPQAAGRIHTDMEKGFIRAEVAHWKDLLEGGSLARLREKGLLRAEGKDYVVADGDVVNFLFKN